MLFVEFNVYSNIDVTSRPLVFCDDQQMTTYGMSVASSYSLGNMTILPDAVSRSHEQLFAGLSNVRTWTGIS